MRIRYSPTRVIPSSDPGRTLVVLRHRRQRESSALHDALCFGQQPVLECFGTADHFPDHKPHGRTNRLHLCAMARLRRRRAFNECGSAIRQPGLSRARIQGGHWSCYDIGGSGNPVPCTTRFALDNNLYWNASGRPITFLTTNPTGGQTDFTFAQWQGLGEDVHSMNADPLFANPGYPELGSREDIGRATTSAAAGIQCLARRALLWTTTCIGMLRDGRSLS